MNTKLLTKYADILLKTGVNLYEGQCLHINASTGNIEFAELLAKQAYINGAKYVEINISSNKMLRNRIDCSKESYLDYAPDYLHAKYNEMLAEDWCYISLDNTEEQDILQGADTSRLSKISKAFQQKKKVFQNNLMNDKHAWCVAAVPGPEWSKKVTGDSNTDKLWEVLIPILQLDKEDPAQAWKEKGDLTKKRSEILNSYEISKINFSSKETDLNIYLTNKARWFGAFSETPEGRIFLPNIPTEEIFTTPDYSKTEGFVKITRPLKVMETIVKGAYFEFKNGKVVNFKADENEDILKTYLEMDEGAAFLGEVALVDSDSPIYKTGKMFHSILYDENASCHIALGAGYPSTFENSSELITDEDRKKQMCNISMVHTDFMIGSDDLNVTGYSQDGKEYKIMQNGKFLI